MIMRIRSHLTEHRGVARKPIDILHREIGSSLMGDSKKMENSVGRTAHSDIESHCIEHCLACGYAARENTYIAVAII
jgi:hypothetical protein